MLEQIRFTARVLGPVATYRLEKRQVTQTIRSYSSSITQAILLGKASAGDHLEILLDNIVIGRTELTLMDAVTWVDLNADSARRGGFDTLVDLSEALKRAGYRFKPLEQYELYRIQFKWLEEVYA